MDDTNRQKHRKGEPLNEQHKKKFILDGMGINVDGSERSLSRHSSISRDSDERKAIEDQEFIEHKELLQRHMDLADFTITDAERILQLDQELDEVDLLVRQIRDSIGEIENIGAHVLKMPAAVRTPLEQIKMIRQAYKQKTRRYSLKIY